MSRAAGMARLAADLRADARTDWQPSPIDPSWITCGTPSAQIVPLAYQNGLSTGFWRCTAGAFDWHYRGAESVYILEGSASICIGESEDWRKFGPGDSITFARNSTATWSITEAVRKFYVIYEPVSLVARVARKLRLR